MSSLQNKIDFKVLVAVNLANPNGDPLWGNRPRTDTDGYGEISDVAIKRKIRDQMQMLGYPIFVQSNERCTDGFSSLSARAAEVLGKGKNETADSYEKRACDTWMDVRAFGQTFAFKGSEKSGSVSCAVRGPVTVQTAVSVAPVEVRTFQITRSTNGNEAEKRSSDTMGTKHFVQHGLYVINGSISPQLAEATGFSEDDAAVLKECLTRLFEGDASAARPEGSMEVVKVYWWKHDSKLGKYNSAKVHRSVKISLNDSTKAPRSLEDYNISVESLDGLRLEELEGL